MFDDELFHVLGRDLLAESDHDVLGPPGDGEVAVGVDRAEVAGAQPAVGGERIGVQRRVEIPQEQLGANGLDLPVGSEPNPVRADWAPVRLGPLVVWLVGSGR